MVRYAMGVRALALLGVCLLSAPALADIEKWEEICGNGDAPSDARVAACTNLIESVDYGDMAWALTERADAFQDLDDHHTALADLNAAIEIDPGYYLAYAWRAWSYTSLQDYASAEADMQFLVVNEPDDAWNHYFLSRVLGYQERFDEALVAIDEAIRLRSEYFIALRQRAWILDDLGRYDEALAAYTDALAVAPFSAPTYYSRGKVYEALGQTTQAMGDYKIALLIDPNQERARRRLDELLVLEPVAAMAPWAYTPPEPGMEIRYLLAVMPAQTVDEMEEAIGELAEWFSGPKRAEPLSLILTGRVVEAVDENTISLGIDNRSYWEIENTERLPIGVVSYRGMAPIRVLLPDDIPGTMFVFDMDALAQLWPLEVGNSVNGTADYAFPCPEEPDFRLRMLGCVDVDALTVGEFTYEITVDRTEQVHVPLGVFETYVVRLREVGSYDLFGVVRERDVETTWWIAPELGFWVRRTDVQGDRLIVTEATEIVR